MVTSVSKSSPDRMRGFWYLYPMFHFKNIRDLTCLFFAVCILMSQSLANDQDFMEEFLKREYSLAKPYRGLGFSSSSQWDLMGTAVVTPDHVRLTPDLQSRQGAVWSRIPLLLRDWELKVHFKIHGLGKKNLNGDGLAIWLTRDRMQNGPVFGNMNQFIGLGIFVDTYPNADKSHDRAFPYISVMLGNGTLSYDHDHDGRTTELGGCTAMARNSVSDTLLLIRYSKNRLMLMVDVDGKQEWKHCVDITGLRLPTGYFFGASSATGDLSDNHDIISMKLYQLTVERTPEEEKEEEDEVTIPRVDDMEQFQVDVQEVGMSGVQFFFTLLFSALGLGVLAVVGLMAYGRWTENRRKRFY
ncbi:lectin, mannose-binding 2-like b isoform X1 [Xiphias gladius]|uniref:lectin, mannose-binding 2-like b isoform X1 n=2 Tax=Xiphias gladius TaxID=8245 RepID=UPI001A98C23A|nr:lectin, mannose-binding 2-like b isoform X1 [Xiphias gladius]XP_040011131.1 lectin, mannose-binding 2-like b isoform X1 [Xiphias gladius]